MGLTEQIPGMYEEIESLVASDTVGQALTYHEAMVSFLLQATASQEDAFVAIKRLRRGEKQHVTESSGGDAGGGGGGGEISWDDGGQVQLDLPGEGGLDLDWGDGGGLDLDSGANVDWDAPVVEVAEVPVVEAGGEGNAVDGGISWEIEVDEAGVQALAEDTAEVTVCTEGEGFFIVNNLYWMVLW